MATIFDTVSSDGILRGILTELLNNTPTPFYPATHSNVVYYKESSVEVALTNLFSAHDKLSALLKETRNDLNEFEESIYGNFKSYMSELLTAVYSKLSNSFSEMTKLSIIIHGLSGYSKEDVDQKFNDFEATLTSSITTLTQYYQQLSNYLTTNYDNKITQTEKLSTLATKVEEFNTSTIERMYDLLNQFRIEIKDQTAEMLEGYYKKSEIDELKTTQDIHISDIKGDVDLMNKETATELKDHLNVTRDAIVERASNEIKSTCSNMSAEVAQQVSSFQSKFDSIMGLLTTIGNRVSNGTAYENADEVRF